jgi:ariadne-1
LPGALKACPKCHAQIEKDGGCDHMTCRCRHEFYWSTLLPYKRLL